MTDDEEPLKEHEQESSADRDEYGACYRMEQGYETEGWASSPVVRRQWPRGARSIKRTGLKNQQLLMVSREQKHNGQWV